MAFDIDGAKKAGYSDEEIARHLAQSNNFDYDSAVKSGYSPAEVMQHLSQAPASSPAAPAETPDPKRSGWDIASGALHAFRNGGMEETTDQDRKDYETATSLPKRGLKGAAVAAERGMSGDNLAQSLFRGTAATKEGYKPKDGEKLGDFAGEMADPMMMPINELGGEAVGLAGKMAKPALEGAGKVASEGVEMLTGVHPHNTGALFDDPIGVGYAKGKDILRRVFGQGSAGKDMQAAKIAAGVTPEEERLIAQVDLGGYKKVADDMAKKVAAGEDLSVGESLAGKKAAGKVSTKGEGSAKAIYGKDRAKFDEILNESAPEVADAQKEVSKVKTADAFMSPFARKGGSAKGHFVRNVLGGGLLAAGNPMGAVFSPITAGLATVLASAATKGASKVASSPVTRAAVIAALRKSKESE